MEWQVAVTPQQNRSETSKCSDTLIMHFLLVVNCIIRNTYLNHVCGSFSMVLVMEAYFEGHKPNNKHLFYLTTYLK